MSLTVGQIAVRVQNNLNDQTGVFFDQPTVLDSILDCYQEVIIDTQCVENTIDVDFQNNLIYYDLYNGIVPPRGYFWRISRIFNANTNRWLRCVDSRVLDKFRFDWEASVGVPWFAYIVNYRYLGFFPHYGTGAVGTFKVLYKVGNDTPITFSSNLLIPDEFIRLVESYSTADLLEIIGEFSKAKGYANDYAEIKQKLIQKLPSRSLPDLVLQYSDLDFPAFGAP